MKKIKRPILLFCVLLYVSNIGIGQDKYLGITFSNNTTGLPVIAYPDLFYSKFHPGLDLTYGKQLNSNAVNKIYLNGNVGFYHHQFVQSLLRIFPTISYERQFSERISASAGLGAGYGLSFEGKNAFTLQDDGSYLNKKFLGARSQYLIALELGFIYALIGEEMSPQLVVQLKSFMQGTYVKSYVPLLPLNSINLGIRLPLNSH